MAWKISSITLMNVMAKVFNKIFQKNRCDDDDDDYDDYDGFLKLGPKFKHTITNFLLLIKYFSCYVLRFDIGE